MRRPTGWVAVLMSSSMEIIVVSPGENISSSGTKTSRPAEYKAETGLRTFTTGSLGIVVNGVTSISSA